LELWEIRQYHERIDRERALEREKKEQEEALKRAAEIRAAALQRKQQEQQARQQQQHLLKMNKKKVQNAIKTQQKKVAVYKPPAVNPQFTYKPAVTAAVPIGALRRTVPVVRQALPSKLPSVQPVGMPQMRTQIIPRTTTITQVASSATYIQRLQPKLQATPQRVYTANSNFSQTSRAAAAPSSATGYNGKSYLFLNLFKFSRNVSIS